LSSAELKEKRKQLKEQEQHLKKMYLEASNELELTNRDLLQIGQELNLLLYHAANSIDARRKAN